MRTCASVCRKTGECRHALRVSKRRATRPVASSVTPLSAKRAQMPSKGEEAARVAYSLQVATWKRQQEAAANPIGPSLPPGLPPGLPHGDASSPSVVGDTLQRGKLALGMQAYGSPLDELRTEPASATAHVLSDFSASSPAELSVSRGEFVTVLVGAGLEVPDGWCHCQVSREGQSLGEEGLVPWYHLVAVKDPEHQAVAQAITAQLLVGVRVRIQGKGLRLG